MLPMQAKNNTVVKEPVVQEQSVLSVDEMKTVINDIKKISNSSNIKSVVGCLDVERKREKFFDKISNILVKFDKISITNEEYRLYFYLYSKRQQIT